MVLCIVLSVVAIGISSYALIADEPDEYDGVRYTMYFGMGERTDEEIEPIENAIIKGITDHSFGYTIEHEAGGYVNNGNLVQDRVSLKFIINVDSPTDDVREIAEKVKSDFGVVYFIEAAPTIFS